MQAVFRFCALSHCSMLPLQLGLGSKFMIQVAHEHTSKVFLKTEDEVQMLYGS